MFLSVLTFLVVLSLLVLVHEYGHYKVARLLGVHVECFSLGFGREVVGWTRGNTRFRVSAIPFGGYVKLAGETGQVGTGTKDEFSAQPIWRRALIVGAGVFANFVFAYVLYVVIALVGQPVLQPVVGELVAGYPAEAAGVMTGDRIVSINGMPTDSWDRMSRVIRRHIDEPLRMTVVRDGAPVEVTITPTVTDEPDAVGRRARRGVIGIAPSGDTETRRYGALEALVVGAQRTWEVIALTLWGLWGLITGLVPLKSISGPVGIAYLSGHAAQLGLVYVIHLMATISVNLGVVNLIPIPALDGGHLLFLGFERLRGRPLSVRVQEVVQQAAVIALIALMLVVTYNDVVNLFSRAFQG